MLGEPQSTKKPRLLAETVALKIKSRNLSLPSVCECQAKYGDVCVVVEVDICA